MIPDLAASTALVTGASGFVGANLCRSLLERGAAVHALVRPTAGEARLPELEPGLRIHRADVRDADALESILRESRPRLIFNLARRRADATPAEADAAREVNEAAVASLLELAARLTPRARLIQLGTSLEGRDDGAYARSKAAATALCVRAYQTGALSTTVLRPVSLYGPWDQAERLIPVAIAAALDGGEVELTSAGVAREWLYVGDLVEACLLAADGRAEGEALELGTGDRMDNLEVVRRVGLAAGRPVAIAPGRIEPRPWDRDVATISVAVPERSLGWRPRTSLDDGLARSVEWARRRREAAVAG